MDGQDYSVGDKVEVRYNPNKPQKSIIDGSQSTSAFLPIITLIFVLVSALITVLPIKGAYFES